FPRWRVGLRRTLAGASGLLASHLLNSAQRDASGWVPFETTESSEAIPGRLHQGRAKGDSVMMSLVSPLRQLRRVSFLLVCAVPLLLVLPGPAAGRKGAKTADLHIGT